MGSNTCSKFNCLSSETIFSSKQLDLVKEPFQAVFGRQQWLKDCLLQNNSVISLWFILTFAPIFFCYLVNTAFASSLYVPSTSQHCGETHGCSLCRCYEQNSYHGNNEYLPRESSAMVGSNRWQHQTRRCNWSTCMYPCLSIQKCRNFSAVAWFGGTKTVAWKKMGGGLK